MDINTFSGILHIMMQNGITEITVESSEIVFTMSNLMFLVKFENKASEWVETKASNTYSSFSYTINHNKFQTSVLGADEIVAFKSAAGLSD